MKFKYLKEIAIFLQFMLFFCNCYKYQYEAMNRSSIWLVCSIVGKIYFSAKPLFEDNFNLHL